MHKRFGGSTRRWGGKGGQRPIVGGPSPPQFQWLKQEGRSQESFAGWVMANCASQERTNRSCRSKGRDWDEAPGHRAEMWLAKQGSQQASRVAQNESGAATGAARALDSLLGFFKAQRVGAWAGHGRLVHQAKASRHQWFVVGNHRRVSFPGMAWLGLHLQKDCSERSM